MKCSRITLLLMLTVLGGVATARATDELAKFPLSKTQVLELLYLDVVRPSQWFESATDWRDNDTATDARDDSRKSDESCSSVREKESAGQEGPPKDDSSSNSDYNGYYGNDANVVEIENGQRETQTNKLANESDESETAASSTTDNGESLSSESSQRETQADDDAEPCGGYEVDYVYCAPEEKVACSRAMAAVYSSMALRLANWAALSADDLRTALLSISERVVRTAWESLLSREANAESDQEGVSAGEEVYP